MTVGALWLIAISAGFAVFALVMVHTTAATVTLAARIVVVAALCVTGIGNIRAVLNLPGQLPPRTPDEQRIRRQFTWVVVAEFVAIVVVNVIVGPTDHVILIPSLDLIIVGIHFLPLARLFRVRRYYPLGVLFCVIPVLVLFAVPESLRLGECRRGGCCRVWGAVSSPVSWQQRPYAKSGST